MAREGFIPGTGCRYSVNTNGDVFSHYNKTKKRSKPHRLKPQIICGYRCISIRINYRKTTKKIAELVLTTFDGSRPTGMLIRHLNDKRKDDRLDNLKWGTHLENMRDMVKNGFSCRGEKNGQSKIRVEDVINIRTLKRTMPTNEIAKMYGISKSSVKYIVAGKRWGHI